MFAAQNQESTVIDALSGSVQQWYAEVDAAMKKSDVVPGTYEYLISPSYGNVGQIQENASTYVDIASTRFTLVSIDNSFIKLKQTVPINPSAALDANKFRSLFYIGYQYAPEAILQYRIYSNSDLIQTVNWANYEWFLLRNSVQPEAKEQSDQFATIEKIRRMDPNVPGVYVDLSEITNATTTVNVELDLRIPLNSFLMLKNLKYFPQWAGKLSIEIIPSYKNIVVCPVEDPVAITTATRIISDNALATAKTSGLIKSMTEKLTTEYNTGFINLNQISKWKCSNITDVAAPVITLDNLMFSCDNQNYFR